MWQALTSFFSGQQAAQPIEAVMSGLDKLFTSDDEKLDKQALFARIAQEPAKLQVELNKIEAQHRSVFVAGWRPFIGWVCGLNLFYLVLGRDLLAWSLALYDSTIPTPPAIGLDLTVELVVALLGLGGLRTLEKFGGKSK